MSKARVSDCTAIAGLKSSSRHAVPANISYIKSRIGTGSMSVNSRFSPAIAQMNE